jgi:hypothetical protein
MELRETEFPLRRNALLNGIIDYLNTKFDGNVGDTGAVEILGEPWDFLDPKVAPRNVADLTANSYFASRNEPNQYIGYDFKSRRVRPTGYVIRSCWNGYTGSENLKSWVIEISDDGTKWTEIDRRENNDDLDGQNIVYPFSISAGRDARFIRLRQIGKNHIGGWCIMISAFEIFGTLIE